MDQAAIDPDVLASDIPAALGRQESDGGGDFLGCAVAAERHVLAALGCLRQAVDPAGQDIIYPDVIGRIGVSNDLHE